MSTLKPEFFSLYLPYTAMQKTTLKLHELYALEAELNGLRYSFALPNPSATGPRRRLAIRNASTFALSITTNNPLNDNGAAITCIAANTVFVFADNGTNWVRII